MKGLSDWTEGEWDRDKKEMCNLFSPNWMIFKCDDGPMFIGENGASSRIDYEGWLWSTILPNVYWMWYSCSFKHKAILYNEAERLSSVLNFQDLMHNRVRLIFLSLYKNYFGSICFI